MLFYECANYAGCTITSLAVTTDGPLQGMSLIDLNVHDGRDLAGQASAILHMLKARRSRDRTSVRSARANASSTSH